MSPDDASQLAALNFSLTPLRGKIPTLPKWQAQPPPSPELVRQWAAMGNLGVRTGTPSGVVVVDAEAKAEQDEAARAVVLKLPPTWTVNTGGGGRHYYFRAPATTRIGNSVGKLAPYVDIRGEGGQVVAVGSVHPVTGAVYEWAPGLGPTAISLATLPGWVVEACTAKPEPKQRSVAAATSNGHSLYAHAALKGECSVVASAPEGVRNDTLNRAAFKLGTLVGAGELDESEVVAALMDSTGLSEREAATTIRSGIAAGRAKPRAPRAAKPSIVDDTRSAITSSKPGAFQTWHSLGLTLNHNGGAHENVANAMTVLEQHAAVVGHFWYDELHYRIKTDWNGSERVIQPEDYVYLSQWFSKSVGMNKIASHTIKDAVLGVAMTHRRHEVREWLEGLKWDGVDRLGTFMVDGFGAEPSELMQRVGQCWLTAMVARAYKPGCKVDNVPVFEGSQGRMKSTAMEILGGKWHTESHESVMSKDFFQSMYGHWLIEIAEMDTFSRAEVPKVKGIITCRRDNFRATYAPFSEVHPRQCVFVCTTNKDDWQRDETGGRRWWPVRCGKIEKTWITEHRDQLFAEAVRRFKAHMDWWEVPIAEAMAAQEERRPEDTWKEQIMSWVERHRPAADYLTMREILTDAVGIPISEQQQTDMNRAGKALSDLGYKSAPTHLNGVSVRIWIKK